MFWWAVATGLICLLTFISGTFNNTVFFVVGGFVLLVTALVLCGRLLAWRRAKVEINNGRLRYTTFTEGTEKINFRRRILVKTVTSLQSYTIARKSIILHGAVHVYDYNQTNSHVEQSERMETQVKIPFYFNNIDCLIADIQQLQGGIYNGQ